MKNSEINSITAEINNVLKNNNYTSLSKEEIDLIIAEVGDNWVDMLETPAARYLEHDIFTLVINKKEGFSWAMYNNTGGTLNFKEIKKILNMKTFW